jgi:hypothetical protein
MRNPLGIGAESLHIWSEVNHTVGGFIMIGSRVVIAGVALPIAAAFCVVSQPVQAGGCVLISAKARGLGEPAASKRSQAKLTRYINHWAHKNKLTAVHAGYDQTTCSKGPVFVCTSSAKVCP